MAKIGQLKILDLNVFGKLSANIRWTPFYIYLGNFLIKKQYFASVPLDVVSLLYLKTSYYLKCLFRTYWFNHSVNNINVYGVLVSSCLSNYNIRVQFKKWSTHTDTQCESVVRMFGRMLEHDRRQRALAIRWETKNDRKISIAVSSLVKTWSTLNFVLMRYFESKSISKNDFSEN